MTFTQLPHDDRFRILAELDAAVRPFDLQGSADWRYAETSGAIQVAVPRGGLQAIETWAQSAGLMAYGGSWHLFYFSACNGERAAYRCDGPSAPYPGYHGSILWAQYQPAPDTPFHPDIDAIDPYGRM